METLDERQTQEERRAKNNEYIKGMGIACLENLPVIESSSEQSLVYYQFSLPVTSRPKMITMSLENYSLAY